MDSKAGLPGLVRDLRIALGETQEQFAARLGLTTRTVARWEATRPPTGSYLTLLARTAWEAKQFEIHSELMRALGEDLNLYETPGGMVSVQLAPDGHRQHGFLLLNLDDPKLVEYAWAFCLAALRRKSPGIEKILADFAAAVRNKRL
jgi:DNA-binding XRE family transcriptional regulator